MRDNNTKWGISPDVRSTYTDDGAVLLDIRKGLCYSLNPVAARIWSTVEASPCGVDLRGLVDALETHYQVSKEQLERDIDECLSNLEKMELLRSRTINRLAETGDARTFSSDGAV